MDANIWASLIAQLVKNPPAKPENWVRSLGREGPLEEGMATPTPAFLPGESPGQRIPAGYSLRGLKESDTTARRSIAWSVPQQVALSGERRVICGPRLSHPTTVMIANVS